MEYDEDDSGLSSDNSNFSDNERDGDDFETYGERLRKVHFAINIGNNDLVIAELNKGFNVNVNFNGWTPLYIAIANVNDVIVQELVRRGAVVDTPIDDYTPLIYACNLNMYSKKTNIYNIVKTLVYHGANVNVADMRGRNGLMLAASNNNLDIVKLLVTLIPTYHEDYQKWTVLFWAVHGRATDCVKYLLNQDFNLNKVDSSGRTVTDIARERHCGVILELLLAEQSAKSTPFIVPALPYLEDFLMNYNTNKPTFICDVINFMSDARCSTVIGRFFDNMSLFNLLSCNNTDLINIGIKYPHQCRQIMSNIYKFHGKPFGRKSIYFVEKTEPFNNINTACVILSCIKQSVIIEASLTFLIKNSNDNLPLIDDKKMIDLMRKVNNEKSKFEIVVNDLIGRNRDHVITTPRLIERKHDNISWAKICLTTGILLGATALIVLYGTF